MKVEDAPPPGWYPDPEARGARLRWWEGTDWTDDRRYVPTQSELALAPRPPAAVHFEPPPVPTPTRAGTEEIVSQVRTAARAEIDRAADLFAQRARATIDRGRSEFADAISRVFRWVRIALVVAALLVVAWFVIGLFTQITLLDWLGDRIDNIGD